MTQKIRADIMYKTIYFWLVAFVSPAISCRHSMEDHSEVLKQSGKCDFNQSSELDKWMPFPGQKSCNASLLLSMTDELLLRRSSECEAILPDSDVDEAPFRINYTLGPISGALLFEPKYKTEKNVYVVNTSRNVEANFQLLPCTTLFLRHEFNNYTEQQLEGMVECALDAKKYAAEVGVFTLNQTWWKRNMINGSSKSCFVQLTDEIRELILPRNARSELVLTWNSSTYVVGSRKQKRTGPASFDFVYDAFADAKMAINTVDGRPLNTTNRRLMISFSADTEWPAIVKAAVTFVGPIIISAIAANIHYQLCSFY